MEVRPSVFIGSSTEGLDVAKAIQVNLDHGCEVVLWSQGVFGLSTGTLDSLVSALDTFDFAVIVVTPDDLVTSRGDTKNAPRDNVLLELGMFIGAIGRSRTFIVYDRTADLKLPSDLAGVTPATYQPHSSNNLPAALGAATTLIQNAISASGRRVRMNESESLNLDTQFQVIHGLMDPAHEQFIIMMHLQNLSMTRVRDPFAKSSGYSYELARRAAGRGFFAINDLCRRLPDAGLLQIDLRDQVSLTARGREFAKWLIDREHKAIYFKCEYGGWGQPSDCSRPEFAAIPTLEDLQFEPVTRPVAEQTAPPQKEVQNAALATKEKEKRGSSKGNKNQTPRKR